MPQLRGQSPKRNRGCASQVKGGIKAGMAPAEAGSAMRKTIVEIERKAPAGTGLRGEVVKLYAGVLFHLYKYKIYTTSGSSLLRRTLCLCLAATPITTDIPDSAWISPSFASMRMKAPQNQELPEWNTSGLKEGELVFSTGNPAFTYRLLTYSQMEFLGTSNTPWF